MFNSCLVYLLLYLVGFVFAGNPLVPNVGMADPHLRVTPNGTFLLFATDDFSSNNTGYVMKDWVLWSSVDLVNWDKAAVIAPGGPSSNFLAWDVVPDECWATDGILVNDTWYWYLSVSPSAVGVVTTSASDLAGPWNDVLGKALLDATLGNTLDPIATFRDPGILADDDGTTVTYYIIAGVFDYYITRLGSDMVSLAETPKLVTIDPNGHEAWGPYGNKTDDKPYLHKHNQTYYLSWGCFYGISSSPYGPYKFQGSVIASVNISADFQMPSDPSQPWYVYMYICVCVYVCMYVCVCDTSYDNLI